MLFLQYLVRDIYKTQVELSDTFPGFNFKYTLLLSYIIEVSHFLIVNDYSDPGVAFDVVMKLVDPLMLQGYQPYCNNFIVVHEHLKSWKSRVY